MRSSHGFFSSVVFVVFLLYLYSPKRTSQDKICISTWILLWTDSQIVNYISPSEKSKFATGSTSTWTSNVLKNSETNNETHSSSKVSLLCSSQRNNSKYFSLREQGFSYRSVLTNNTYRASWKYSHNNYQYPTSKTLRFIHKKQKRTRMSRLYYPNKCATLQILLQGGDISTNPGPRVKRKEKLKCEWKNNSEKSSIRSMRGMQMHQTYKMCRIYSNKVQQTYKRLAMH